MWHPHVLLMRNMSVNKECFSICMFVVFEIMTWPSNRVHTYPPTQIAWGPEICSGNKGRQPFGRSVCADPTAENPPSFHFLSLDFSPSLSLSPPSSYFFLNNNVSSLIELMAPFFHVLGVYDDLAKGWVDPTRIGYTHTWPDPNFSWLEFARSEPDPIFYYITK